MNGDYNIFTTLEKKRGSVSYNNNGKGKVTSIDKAGKSPSIDSVYFVKGLQHNLISISQLYNNEYHVLITHANFLLLDKDSYKPIYKGKWVGNLYSRDRDNLTPIEGKFLLSQRQDELV